MLKMTIFYCHKGKKSYCGACSLAVPSAPNQQR